MPLTLKEEVTAAIHRALIEGVKPKEQPALLRSVRITNHDAVLAEIKANGAAVATCETSRGSAIVRLYREIVAYKSDAGNQKGLET